MSFVYDIPTKVFFGEGQIENLGAQLSVYGSRVLLVYGGGSIKKTGVYDKIVAQIKGAGLELYELSGIEPNPKVESVRRGIEICKKNKIDVCLAAGGGSAMDASKFIAAGACSDEDIWTIVSKKIPVTKALPIVTVLTISATGSEMDPTAVLSNMQTNEKSPMSSPLFFPKASFCDPTFTYSVGANQTACGSADILSHLMEVYFNRNQNLFMLDRCMEGMMKTVIKYAPLAMKEPDNYEARANLMWTSSWAINGFTSGCNKAPWSCHPVEHQLSAYYDITHGLGLAIVTPRWMRYVLANDDEQGSRAQKFYEFGVNVFGIDPSTGKMVDGGIEEQTERVCKNLMAILEAAGLTAEDTVKTTCFITDMKDFPKVNAVYEKYFTGKPARSCVQVAALPKSALVEIEAIAQKRL